MTTTQSGPATVATAYFEAWRDNDIERVRPLLDPQVDFAGALGTTHGGEETLQGLAGMFAMTERVEVIKRWVHGPDAITWFELCTGVAGPIPVVNCSHVQDGLIKARRRGARPSPKGNRAERKLVRLGDLGDLVPDGDRRAPPDARAEFRA